VLDDRFLGSDPRACTGVRPQWHDSFDEGDAIQIDVQVTVRRGLDAIDAVQEAEGRGELLCDDARRLAQRRASSNATGRCEIAELALRRYSIGSCGRRQAAPDKGAVPSSITVRAGVRELEES
jgi:hypothetical protein